VVAASFAWWAGSLAALAAGKARFAAWPAAGAAALVVGAWALGQYPDFAPGEPLERWTAPQAVLKAMLWSVAAGLSLLLPSLWALFKVFKSGIPGGEHGRQGPPFRSG
jgi:hypothetical protein